MANTTPSYDEYTTLYDSNTNNKLTADELEITDDEYADAIRESVDCGTAEGHVTVNGRRVYASTY